MISGMSAPAPPTFKKQLIRTSLEKSVRSFFLLGRKRSPNFFQKYSLAMRSTLRCFSKKRGKIFGERGDTTLSGNFVEKVLSVGSSVKHSSSFVRHTRRGNSAPTRITDRNMRSSDKLVERNLRKFGCLEGFSTSEWCCAPFIVAADQNTIDGWGMVVDFRNFNAETTANSSPLPLIQEEIAKRARVRLFSVLQLRHGFHEMLLRKDSQPLTCICTPCGPVQ